MYARPTGLSFLRFGAVRRVTTALSSGVGSPPFIAVCAFVRESIASATGCGLLCSISHAGPSGAGAAVGCCAKTGDAATIVAAARMLRERTFINLLLLGGWRDRTTRLTGRLVESWWNLPCRY